MIGGNGLKKKVGQLMISLKKGFRLNKKNKNGLKNERTKEMSNTLNYLDLAYQQMHGISYDELLELQTETGLSIEQLEFMYYKL